MYRAKQRNKELEKQIRELGCKWTIENERKKQSESEKSEWVRKHDKLEEQLKSVKK